MSKWKAMIFIIHLFILNNNKNLKRWIKLIKVNKKWREKLYIFVLVKENKEGMFLTIWLAKSMFLGPNSWMGGWMEGSFKAVLRIAYINQKWSNLVLNSGSLCLVLKQIQFLDILFLDIYCICICGTLWRELDFIKIKS